MERLDRIEKILEELMITRKENEERRKLYDEKQTKHDEKQAKYDRKFDKLHAEMAAIGHSNGDAAEAFFYNSLEDDLKLGNIKFDFISKNVKQKKHRQEEEYDIFLENGNSVGIIEVKYKVQQQHIEKLLSKKAENFRILFPDYTDYKLYIGIAGLSFESNTEKFATENGLVVLKQQGTVMQINSSSMKAF